MFTRIDTYKHLDASTKVSIELSMEDIARRCVSLNYGAHRLLSALVHELRSAARTQRDNALRRDPSNEDRYPGTSELADGIEKLLNSGLVC